MILRLVLSVGVMLWAWLTWGPYWVQQCLPFYGWVFEHVAPDLRLVSLLVSREGMDQVVRATVGWKHTVVIGEHVIYPHPLGTANASTLLAHAFTGPMVALCCASVWPVMMPKTSSTWAQRWCRFASHLLARYVVVLLLAVGLVAVDVPVVLAGELWHMALAQLSPETTSAVVLWRSFMQAGGRYALGLCAGALAVAVVQRLSPGLTSRP
jgi:hypothetical protein